MRERELPGAVVTRVASSHIRVGTFQFALMNNNKNYIEELTNYTINNDNKALKLLVLMFLLIVSKNFKPE